MAEQSRRRHRIAIHTIRVSLFGAILALIHFQHASLNARHGDGLAASIDLAVLREFFPDAIAILDEARDQPHHQVLDTTGQTLGYILQTSPNSDHVIGFSGPTNTLIALDNEDRIIGIEILSSGDTRDHVAHVLRDERFLNAFSGRTWDQATQTNVDAVSGATLTSSAIQESIIHRLGGKRPSLRFPDPLTVDDARAVFESAHSVQQDKELLSLWYVENEENQEIGTILRTSPFSDNIVGYQGPTEARICFDVTGAIAGLSIGRTYDNEEYVTYVREDDHFLTLFNDLKLPELASFDLETAQIEGVSGATMTSMAIADGLITAAEQHRLAVEAARQPRDKRLHWTARDVGTGAVVAGGVIIALTSLRRKKLVRFGLQLVLIVYLGLINGEMLSQAMIVGWAQSGIPWSKAGGLFLLTAAAFLVPITTRRNAYCTHLCPHGAAQQLFRNRLPWRVRMPPRVMRALRMIPGLLLLWCVVVTLAALPFSLVDIEPFDAWVFHVAGWAAIAIAVVGLVASLFVPMAYCRYGCPTGALLGYLRYNSRSDQWSRRDWFALMLLVLACGLLVGSN